ncbi:MAG: cyclase family protein [Chlamydiales bacterium]|nr:cyclase family protein [Chlamydiales bacterium]
MSKRFIDLSISIDNNPAYDPPMMPVKVDYHNHEATVGSLQFAFPGLQREDLPDGEGWAIERLELWTHNGTHLDAPYHYSKTMDNGKRAITIDEVPLDWCFRPGIKLDFRHLPDGHIVTASEVESELKRIGHTLQPYDIVIINTRAGSVSGKPEFLSAGCGMGREATLYLLERGVKVTGTDAWSWDAPFAHTAKRWAETKDPSIIWEGHKAGRDISFCHMEKMHNLEELPPHGFTIACFPVKIKGASGGWTRAVAIID